MKLELIFDAIFILVFLYLLLLASAGSFARIRRERRELRLAVEGSAVEIPRFLLLGLIPGLAVSTALALLGVTISWPMLLAFVVLTVLGAALPGFYTPLLYGLAGVGGLLCARLAPGLLPRPTGSASVGFSLVLACVMLFAVVADLCAPYHSSPHIIRSHGRRRLQKRVRQLIFLPLLVPVPGAMLKAWPLLKILSPEINGLNFVLLPLVLGFGLSSFTSVRAQLRRRAVSDAALLAAAVVTAILASMHLISSDATLLIIAGVALIGMGSLLLVPRHEQNALTDAAGGVRVVAVIPGTPAAKMGLQSGDTILQCNGVDVPTARAFYTATQHLGTFCRLRVRDGEGRFRLAETAIFTGAPHMLGVMTFPEED